MKKTSLLFIPLVLSSLSLVGCKDYKFDSPKAVIRNLTDYYSKNGARLVYPYETNADNLTTHGRTCYISDVDNIVLKKLKKATFEEGSVAIKESERSISFELDSYTSQNAVGDAFFQIYDNGFITYSMQYFVSVKPVNLKKEYFHFVFDAELAKSIVDEVYEEFDRAKAEEERFIWKQSPTNFINAMEKRKGVVNIYNDRTSYYDNGEILAELRKLDFTSYTKEENVSLIFNWKFIYHDRNYSDGVDYEGGYYNYWECAIGEDSESNKKFARFWFWGDDSFRKSYDRWTYFTLSDEQYEAFIQNTSSIAEKLELVKNN